MGCPNSLAGLSQPFIELPGHARCEFLGDRVQALEEIVQRKLRELARWQRQARLNGLEVC